MRGGSSSLWLRVVPGISRLRRRGTCRMCGCLAEHLRQAGLAVPSCVDRASCTGRIGRDGGYIRRVPLRTSTSLSASLVVTSCVNGCCPVQFLVVYSLPVILDGMKPELDAKCQDDFSLPVFGVK